MNNSIIKKIKSLPPLDETVVMIQKISTDKNSSLQDLVKVVEKDPMLTANILKFANSPLYGFSKEIKTISHATSLFGMATIRGFALSSSIKENIKINLSPYNITNQKFLDISTTQSILMFKWYSKVNRGMLDILQPAAFMMEVGKLIISHELIESGKDEEFKRHIGKNNSIEKLTKIEKEIVGFSNEEVTAKIFEKWNLESELVEAIKFSNTPNRANEYIQNYCKALHVVKNTVNIFGIFRDKQKTKSLELMKEYKLDSANYINILEQFDI